MISLFRVSIIASIFLILISCSTQKGYLPYEGLKGNPSQVEILTYDPIPENSIIEPSMSSREIYYFDEIGRKTRYQILRGDGSPVNGGIGYFYPRKGPVKYQEYYDLDGGIRSKLVFEYYRKGRLVKSESISGNKVTIKKTIYDRNKDISYTTLIDPNGSLMQNSVNQLDKKGRTLVMTDYHNNGAQKIKLEFEYDKNGNEILSKWYNSDNRLYEFYKKQHNSKNEEILLEKFQVSRGDTLLISKTTTEYLYDTQGNQSHLSIKTEGSIYLKKVVVSYPLNQ